MNNIVARENNMQQLRSQFRQEQSDRRKDNVIYKVPFVDSDGGVVRADRRVRPDRRVLCVGANIAVSEHIEF